MLTTLFFRLTFLTAFFLVLTSGFAVPDLSLRNHSLVVRDAEVPPLCVPVAGQPWNYADGAAINEGLSYLSSVAAPCSAGPGPGNCVRVSCSWLSAITLCNDNPDAGISFPCSIVVDRVNTLIEYCAVYPPRSNYLIGGQIFDTGGWNVVVHDDSC